MLTLDLHLKDKVYHVKSNKRMFVKYLYLLSEESSYVEFSVDTKIKSAYKWGLWITQVISTS